MRSPYFIFIIFAAIGIPFLLLMIYFSYSSIQQLSTWETVEGKIIDFTRNDNPIIAYQVGDKSYEITSFYRSDDKSLRAYDVYFPPGHPEQAEDKSFMNVWFLPLIFSVFGIAFGGVGIFGVLYQLKKSKAKDELFTQQRGKKLSLPITFVGYNTSYSINGRHPYIINAEWIDPISSIAYKFTSENMWADPTPFISAQRKIDVYIDESNPKRYYVNVTFAQKS
ncbi:MAG: DUF3592 domain-containing protein [Cyclobacteriaceae bacterium]|nr:DUF3592 domain-containing protein [Cyclobacteriaceae bacterium]